MGTIQSTWGFCKTRVHVFLSFATLKKTRRYERTFPDHFILPSFHLRVFFHDQDVDILFPRFLASHGCFEEKRCTIASDVGVHGTKRSGRARNKPVHHAEEPQKQLAKN